MLWEDTFIDLDQRIRVINQAPTVAYDNELNADRLFLNRDIISLVKRFSHDMDFTIFYRYTKKPIVERCHQKCGFTTNVRLTWQGNDFWSREIVPLLNEQDFHHVFIICNEKQITEIKGGKTFQELLKNKENVDLQHILPKFYGPSWGYFAQYTADTEKDSEHAYMFSASVFSLSNYFSFILNKPSQVQFLHRNRISNIQSHNLIYPHPCRTKDLFLFDYYRSSANSMTKDDFSRYLVSRIKNGSAANNLSLFFCEAILSHIRKSSVDPDRCLFLVYPSSSEDHWNDVLMDSMSETLHNHGYATDTLKGLRRIKNVQKQHLTSQRDTAIQINSIQLEINDVSRYEYAIIIDDLTSTGTSFSSAAAILQKAGFQGFIQSYAVGGTQYSGKKSVLYQPAFGYDRREVARNAYIFDLDNTIIETDIALPYRESGDWKTAYSMIPNMRQYYCVVDSIKQLIRRGIDVAIVTSSPTEYCVRIMRYLGISLNNVVCVCFHDTENHKPNPDPFIVASKLMKHNNMNIFCVGDQISDILACDNANQADPDHTYIPLFACWQSNRWKLNQDNRSELRAFTHELQFVQYLGFILPAANTLENLINTYIRPVFFDMTYSNEQIYELLEEKGYLTQSMPGSYVPTEKGRSCGLRGSYTLPIYRRYQNSNILCDTNAQYEIIALLTRI